MAFAPGSRFASLRGSPGVVGKQPDPASNGVAFAYARAKTVRRGAGRFGWAI